MCSWNIIPDTSMCRYVVQMDVENDVTTFVFMFVTFILIFDDVFSISIHVCGLLYFARWHGFMSCPNTTDVLPNAMELAHFCASGSATVFSICAWSQVK